MSKGLAWLHVGRLSFASWPHRHAHMLNCFRCARLKHKQDLFHFSKKSNKKYCQINHWVGGAGGGRNRRLSGNHGTHYNIYTDKNGLHQISAGGLKYFLKELFSEIFMQY